MIERYWDSVPCVDLEDVVFISNEGSKTPITGLKKIWTKNTTVN